MLRADFALNESLRLPHPPTEVGCPVVAFGAVDDPEVATEGLGQWRAVAKEHFTLRLFTGGHFYIASEKNAVLAAITDVLAPIVCREKVTTT